LRMTAQQAIETLELYTDRLHMRRRLQVHVVQLLGDNLTILDCRIVESRFKPFQNPESWHKASLNVYYELDVRGSARPHILYAHVFLQGRSDTEYREYCTRAKANAVPQHVPDLDMVVWRFPLDPAMDQLSTLWDMDWPMGNFPLDKAPGYAVESYTGLERVDRRVVKYSPERSCIIRFDLPQRIGTQTQSARALYAKIYAGRDGELAYERQRFFNKPRSPDNSGLAVHTAPALVYDPSVRIFWQGEAAGDSLESVLAHDNVAPYLDQIGRGLASVHASGLGGTSVVKLGHRVFECSKKIAKLVPAFPSCATRLKALSQTLERAAATYTTSVAAGDPVTLYGDFHPRQMLIADGKVCFLDFDSMVKGDPESDLAEFFVALLNLGLQPERVREAVAHILMAYQRDATRPLCHELLRLYARIEYMEHAYRLFLRLDPGWRETFQNALDRFSQLENIFPDRRRGICRVPSRQTRDRRGRQTPVAK
jgi:Phosphotransferase enzyme family